MRLSLKIELQMTSGNPKAIGMPAILFLFFQGVMALLRGGGREDVKNADIVVATFITLIL